MRKRTKNKPRYYEEDRTAGRGLVRDDLQSLVTSCKNESSAFLEGMLEQMEIETLRLNKMFERALEREKGGKKDPFTKERDAYYKKEKA